MKKFLLSIFAVMLAVFSVQAEEVSGTITFKTSGSDNSTAATNANFVSNQVTNNGGFTLSCTATNNCYTGKSGLKMSSSKANGSFTLNLGGTYNVKKVIVNAVKYSSDAANLSVNSAIAQTLTTSLADYTFEINKEISTIKVDMAKRGYIASITIVYEVAGEGGGETPDVPVVETVATPTITAESTTFNEGESLTVTIETETEGAEIYYTLDGTEPSAENGELYEGEIEITETTTVKAIAVKDGWNNSEVAEAKFTKTVVIEGGIVDTLNRELTGVSGTNYKSWSGVTVNSSAVYAGQSAGSNDAIQLRSNNSNSGIVTTVSGGKVKKIAIDWNSNTDATRELWVYGKNTAYTNPTELYDASTDGDKLAEIVCGTTEFVIEGDYEYIGLRSGSGAMYLNSIEITWVEEEEEPATETWSSFYASFPVAIPEGVEAYIVTAANAGYVTLTQIYNAVPAGTGVILKGGSIEATYDNYYSGEVTEVTGNLLKGTMENENISEEAYVLAKVDGVIGLYKAEMNQLGGSAWLNNANKAYLPASEVPAEVKSLSFRFPGTTGIENVVVENGVNVIFDLTGRKVEAISAPGIYIVNGKKVLVK